MRAEAQAVHRLLPRYEVILVLSWGLVVQVRLNGRSALPLHDCLLAGTRRVVLLARVSSCAVVC